MNKKAENVAMKYMPQVIIFVLAVIILIIILWIKYSGLTLESAFGQLTEVANMLMNQ